MAKNAVIGSFGLSDPTVKAIKGLRENGFDNLEVFSPFPSHDIDDEMYRGKPRSPVRRLTMLGALTGISGAFLMTCWMSIDYPIRVSAKPLISIPAFIIIAFECTVLLGTIFTLLAMFNFSRIPNIGRFPTFRGKFTNGTFGVVVTVSEGKEAEVTELLKTFGASDVEVQYVR